jgi:hypothetical protein
LKDVERLAVNECVLKKLHAFLSLLRFSKEQPKNFDRRDSTLKNRKAEEFDPEKNQF